MSSADDTPQEYNNPTEDTTCLPSSYQCSINCLSESSCQNIAISYLQIRVQT